jgi:hypothetical protein
MPKWKTCLWTVSPPASKGTFMHLRSSVLAISLAIGGLVATTVPVTSAGASFFHTNVTVAFPATTHSNTALWGVQAGTTTDRPTSVTVTGYAWQAEHIGDVTTFVKTGCRMSRGHQICTGGYYVTAPGLIPAGNQVVAVFGPLAVTPTGDWWTCLNAAPGIAIDFYQANVTVNRIDYLDLRGSSDGQVGTCVVP